MAAREQMKGTSRKLKMIPKKNLPKYVTAEILDAMVERCKTWGRWGEANEIGTLNYITPDDIVNAARLVRKGKAFSLAIPFDNNGPQFGGGFGGRFNPIHTMLATGTDSNSGVQAIGKLGIPAGYADDMVTMTLQCATQWDGLGHVFYKDKMWNDKDSKLVDSLGAAVNGIEKTKDKMIGRGVLLDIPRYKGGDYLEPGYGISIEDLEGCAKAQDVEVRRGDFLICRTGIMAKIYSDGNWGTYAGGDAAGLMFETAAWLHDKQIAAIVTDTWGCEVRPNESPMGMQPWHVPMIPGMGISMGEIWYLEELAEDCADDQIYEFMLIAPVLPITGAVGSPVNPQAIK